MSLNARHRLLTRSAVVAAAVAVPLILLVLTLLVDRDFDQNAMLRQEATRSYGTRVELQQILSAHQDLESGQRGFAITGDERFLEPYRHAVGQIDAVFALLDRSLLRDPDVRRAFEALKASSREKRRLVERTIALTRAGRRDAAQRLIAEGEDKRLMDRIRTTISGIAEVERGELERRTGVADAARARLRTRTIALQTILMLMLAGAALLVARSNAARKAALFRSQDLTARQDTIFESAKDGMIVLNPSGSMESLNSAAAAMFGYAPAALLRRDIGLLFEVAPDRGQVESFLRRLSANRRGSVHEVQEFVGRRSDGSSFPLEVSVSPVRLVDHTLFLAVIRDISERRQVEQMKGEFVSTVSHELRTPLTSIAGSLGLITGGAAGEIPPKARRLIEIAHSNSARLVRLINDILDIEKIEAGRMEFRIRPIEIDGILRHAIRDAAGFAAEYGVQVEMTPPPAGATVLADEDRLMQVLTNLLSNAIKFSPRGETVRLLVTPLDRRFRISVADRGIGIPEAFHGRIFSKFAQADGSDTRQKGGTGLGLSIVREIVQRLAGSVSFESKEGEGTVFHVDLPAGPAAAPTAAPEPASAPTPAQAARRHILHVDDDPDMLRILASAFEGRAMVYSTPSVVEARAAIRRQAFDAAILDIGLVDGCGTELVPLLRQHHSGMPVVVFTAQEVEQRKLAGVDLTLVKSRASLDRLVDEMTRLLDAAQAEQAE